MNAFDFSILVLFVFFTSVVLFLISLISLTFEYIPYRKASKLTGMLLVPIWIFLIFMYRSILFGTVIFVLIFLLHVIFLSGYILTQNNFQYTTDSKVIMFKNLTLNLLKGYSELIKRHIMKIFHSFRESPWFGVSLILILVFSGIIISFLWRSSFQSNINHDYYSLLAQVQASIFAIVISLTLVAFQLASQKYSIRISQVFLRSRTFWGTFVVYVISIFFDIWAISSPLSPDREILLIGTFLFMLTFLVLSIYFQKVIEMLSPEKLVELFFDSITLEDIKQHIENPLPITDKFLPIRELLDVAIKSGDFRLVQMIAEGITLKFEDKLFTNKTVRDPLWEYFEKLVSILYHDKQKIKESSYDFDNKNLEWKKVDIEKKIYLYLMYFLDIPNDILENARKLKNLRLFQLGFWTFTGISFAFMKYLQQIIKGIEITKQIREKDVIKWEFKALMGNIIQGGILYYLNLHSKNFLKFYNEEKPHDIYGVLSVYESIIDAYKAIGFTCVSLDIVSPPYIIAEKISTLTLSFFNVCSEEIRRDILDLSISGILYIIEEILSTLKDPKYIKECEINDLVGIFREYIFVLEDIVKVSIENDLESSAINGMHAISKSFEFLSQLVKKNIKEPIRYSIRGLSEILTSMQVDPSELKKLKPDTAVYVTKTGISLLNTCVEELSKSCNVELLEFCLKEIDKIYKVAYEKYGFCWPYHDRILLTSNTLVTSLETLINNCSGDIYSLIKTTSDILTSFVINLLQSSIEKDWDKIEKENRINSAKEVTEHLIYLGYILTKHGELEYATDLSVNLVKINQRAIELGFSGFVRSIFKKIKETKRIGIQKKTHGSVSISEFGLRFLGDDLKTLEEFEKLYSEVGGEL